MRVFVTGATGFIGAAVVKELLSAGHSVLGLSRSTAGADKLKSQGAEPLHGTIQDLALLKKAASECDAVIHLAFIHDFSDFAASCATDRAAIEALGAALAAAGGDRALVVTSGTMMLPHGTLGGEQDRPDTGSPLAVARGASETACLDFAGRGVRACVVRLPPTTHGPGSSGFTGIYLGIARDKGVAAYVGDGGNRWCAAHRDDAAVVYRLAAERGKAGSVFHAVAEEGVPVRDIAAEVGKQLRLPVVSIPADKAQDHFGWFQFGGLADNIASSQRTREELGWTPAGPTLMANMETIIKSIEA
ncbi:hypothetical protein HIM_03407 [Hirsutella minnesotensis 3608]|uniref:NAD-dependent epimerase/dehydratase domain-containing protein n=1 Tax=Hirsutella minnesotensis 3608 TaxID=1043627 RepID=A0A0F7ZM99_9HYPO|nr:hypothetical protein HIM_03407 [Hirsutella minnesotensis 3608]